MNLNPASKYLSRNYFFLNIAFILVALFIIFAGNWSINNNKTSLKRVYSFRLFSRGHFQVINANTKAINYLNLGFMNSDQDQLIEGITHLETSLGFIYSLMSELEMEKINSNLIEFVPVYEDLIKQYESIIDKKLTKSDHLIRKNINRKLIELNKTFGFEESRFWIERATEFENIRKRNVLFETLYWIFVVSISLGIAMLVYFSIERSKLEKELEAQRYKWFQTQGLQHLGSFRQV